MQHIKLTHGGVLPLRIFARSRKCVERVDKRGHHQKIGGIYRTLPVTMPIPDFGPCSVRPQRQPHTRTYVTAGGALVLIYSSTVSSVKVLQSGRKRKSEISAYSHWQLKQMWKCEKGSFRVTSSLVGAWRLLVRNGQDYSFLPESRVLDSTQIL